MAVAGSAATIGVVVTEVQLLIKRGMFQVGRDGLSKTELLEGLGIEIGSSVLNMVYF